jgi:hypoxanthine phosphoribosyltransferase
MLGRVVLSREQIGHVIRRLAEEIDSDLEGRSPIFIGVLKGCVYFFTALTQALSHTVEVDFIQASSYGAGTESSGTVVLIKDITADVRGRDVYLVEDIVDTGTTLADIVQLIQARHPRSIQIVALLSKPSRRKIDIDVDFLGLEIDDVFVVGFGLDFAEQYRNLPDIHEYVPEEGQ